MKARDIMNKIFSFFKLIFSRPAKAAEKVEAEAYEYCALCGAQTSVPVSMPVDWRENYEIGFGQLCVKCAGKQQGKKLLSDNQIILAVERSRKENEE
jgi:hypothetical protein